MSDPLFSIEGRSIIIAGAASGLGRALSLALASRGALLTLMDLVRDPLLELASACGSQTLAQVVDVTDERSVTDAVHAAQAAHGKIDALVNSAGLLRIAPAHDLTEAQFKASLDVNVTGAFLLSRAAARAMAANGGRIVHFASVSSLVANKNYAAYSTSKAALSQLVKVLAREWAGDGITVNTIGPAMTETGMTGSYLSDEAFRAQALAAIPMGRFGTPDDLLGPLILLLSPAGKFITGQTLYVDGGRTLV